MLKNTFCHMHGIGPGTESLLWENNIRTWDDFLKSQEAPPRKKRHGLLNKEIEESFARLGENDAAYFSRLLPKKEHWRLFPDFRPWAAYLDIETNGVMGPGGYITTIALYDGKRVRHYVRGRNLEAFKEDIKVYTLLVTYNGKCFDIPFIEGEFGIKLEQAHIDLMHVMRSLGFRGGLKGCERALGIGRGELEGLDGYFAVLLWEDFLRSSNPRTLDTLLAYNIEDAVNLERLLIHSYNLKIKETPFSTTHRIAEKDPPKAKIRPDRGTIERVLAQNPWYCARLVNRPPAP